MNKPDKLAVKKFRLIRQTSDDFYKFDNFLTDLSGRSLHLQTDTLQNHLYPIFPTSLFSPFKNFFFAKPCSVLLLKTSTYVYCLQFYFSISFLNPFHSGCQPSPFYRSITVQFTNNSHQTKTVLYYFPHFI